MRADLQNDSSTVTLLSDEELISFYSETGAKAFLNQFTSDPSNMDVMRRALGEELGNTQVLMMTDLQVIDALALQLARTCVAWAKVDLLPTISADYTGAEAEDEEQEANEALSEENESEPEEVKPEPVIPPEFPILAKLEGDSIIDNTDNYNLQLDLLRYVGMGSVPEAKVPKEVLSSAISMGNHVVEESAGLGGTLQPLARMEDTITTPSEVGMEAGALGKSMMHPLVAVALAFAHKLRVLMGMAQGEPENSQVAEIFRLLTGGQGSELMSSVDNIGAVLDALFGPEEEKPEPEKKVLTFTLEDVYATPMPKERFLVEMPDGTLVSGSLDDEGRGKLEDVGEGPFVLSFPSITSPWKIVAGQNPEMIVHKVVSGDTLGKIAKNYGVPSWVSIYEHDANASFRTRRPNPNLIYPGDQIYIPDPNTPPCVWEINTEEPNRCRLIDPLRPELADDTRIWIKYVWQQGNSMALVGNAHENVDWKLDVFEHPRNAAIRKSRKTAYDFKPEDVLYIPVPDKPTIRYVVQDGDTPRKIAASHMKDWLKDIYNFTLNEEFKASHIEAGYDFDNSDTLTVGDVLEIPRDDLAAIEFQAYEVKPCDCLERIGAAFGVDWKKDIYNHWRNAQLKKKRPDPTLIYPGDVVFIQKNLIKKNPQVAVEDEFKVYTIRKGDSLSLIAANNGIVSWKSEIYDIPANAIFRTKRTNPNLIQPGDEICLPLAEVKSWIEFEITGDDDQPLPGVNVEIKLSNGVVMNALSDNNGIVKFSDVPDGKFEIVSISHMDNQEVLELTDANGNVIEDNNGKKSK